MTDQEIKDIDSLLHTMKLDNPEFIFELMRQKELEEDIKIMAEYSDRVKAKSNLLIKRK